MAQTIIGLFGSANAARQTVAQLRDGGFGQEELSLIGPGEVEEEPGAAVAGAGMGAAGGALFGGAAGLLAGIGVLAIPGIGPLLAAGPILATLTGAAAGAAVGAVAGGLTGALIVAGIPEESARRYTERVRAGHSLIAVTTRDDRADDAAAILRNCGAGQVERHARPDVAAAPMSEPPARTTARPDALDREFQRHFAGRGAAARAGQERYEDFRPAYTYGAQLSQEMYGRNFDLSIGEVRQRWEAEHPGTWDQYHHAIRYGWERGRPPS